VPDTGHRLSPADSAALVERLIDCWQILPSLNHIAIDTGLRSLLTPADYERVARVRLAISCFARAQTVVARPLLLALQQRRIRYSLLKGSATGHVLYDTPAMRTGWDLDLAVAKDTLEVVRQLAEEIGYTAAQQDATSKRFYRADP